jgi:hypothetical protein
VLLLATAGRQLSFGFVQLDLDTAGGGHDPQSFGTGLLDGQDAL